MSHRYKYEKRSAKPNIPLAQQTLIIAKDELKGAKALYDGGVYPMAIFSLQQSMEKGWKSFGFYYGIINEQDARSKEIGHKGSRVCNKTIRALQRIVSRLRSNVRIIRSNYNVVLTEQESKEDILQDFESNLHDISTELTQYSNDETKYRNLSVEEIDELIKELTSFIRAVGVVENILNNPSFTDQQYEQIKQGAFEMGKSVFRGFPQAEDVLKKVCFEELTNEKIKKIIDNTIKGISVITPLLSLAIITQAHEQSTRYIIDGQSPTDVYSSSHPLIQKFTEIYPLAETTLDGLGRFYDSLPSGGNPS
jgi:hypothetical protein